MLEVSWLLIFLAMLSGFVGLRLIKEHKAKPDNARLLFGRFCLLTGLFQLFQGLLYMAREQEMAIVLVAGSYFSFVFSQLAMIYFIHWFTDKTLPRFFALLSTIMVTALCVLSVIAPFFTPIEENLFFRNAMFPGFGRTVFYDFEPGLIFNLDLVLALILNMLIFLTMLWFCRKSGRGIFSRIPLVFLVLLMILVHDFATANGFFPSTYLYEITVMLLIFVFNRELGGKSAENIVSNNNPAALKEA